MRSEWFKTQKINSTPRWAYTVRVSPRLQIREKLGAIQQRADGRWNWWRWSSRRWSSHHHLWTTGQGVALNESDAEDQVMEGWAQEVALTGQ